MATITKVWLDESENECTMCGACEATCPEVFEVPEKMVVRPDAQLGLTDQVVDLAVGEQGVDHRRPRDADDHPEQER